MLLGERNRVAGSAASKALEKPAVGMNVKRGRFLAVERTQTDEIVPAFAQRNVLGDELAEIGPSQDLSLDAVVDPHEPYFAARRPPPTLAAARSHGLCGGISARLSHSVQVKRIYDPVHRFIEVSDAEAALLDTMPMQRLRRLRQLGLAYLAFPAAEHSRFTHALGAMAVGDRVLESVRRHDADAFASEAEYQSARRLLRAALLVHDVGHGPFSHACEAVLGIAYERRTNDILLLPQMRAALERLDVDPLAVVALVVGNDTVVHPVLRELVSGPNLDADRMDYLLRDAYFTGVTSGHYDSEQLIGSLRTVVAPNGERVLGVDGRGTVALESLVLARYMMFATVYFHHTTRTFEHLLHEALHAIWPDPHALDPVEEFMEWDDFRVLDELRGAPGEAASALRDRNRIYAVIAEFNAEADLAAYQMCRKALAERYGEAVWADEQEQPLHRLPFGNAAGSTVYVRTRTGVVDARDASDLIARLAGKAYWRKLFLRRGGVDIDEARALCANLMTPGHAGRAREFPPLRRSLA